MSADAKSRDWRQVNISTVAAGLAALACAAVAFYVTVAFLDAREVKQNESVFVQFFAARMEGTRLLGKGWLPPDTLGTWSEGSRAELRWPLEGTPATDISVTLTADVFPFDVGFKQAVQVAVNDAVVSTLTANIDGGILGGSFNVPAHIAAKQSPMVFVFKILRPTSPKAQGINADERLIGIRLKNISLRYSPGGPR